MTAHGFGRGFGLSLAALAALALPSPAGARAGSPIVGFAPGHWTGTMKIEGGIDNGRTHASGHGSGRFSFTVDPRGTVQSGHISITETIVTTSSSGTFNSSASGSMPLTGDSVTVIGEGSLQFHIETPYGPIDGPVEGQIPLHPLTVTCSTAKGDAAIPARQYQTASGFATNVTGLFTAHRRSSSSPDRRNLSRELRAVRADLGLYLAHPANPVLVGLAADAVRDLSRAVAAASGCGSPPAGFEHGIAGQRQLGRLVKHMFSQAAANHRALGAEKLEAVIEAAVESHATSAHVHGLVAGLEDLMLQSPLSTDAAGLRGVLRIAALYNLGDLAAAAQTALTKLGGL